MALRKVGKKQKGRDAFAKDQIEGEYEKPGPRLDPDAAKIADALSKINGREKTGFVTRWLPLWGKRGKIGAFSFYFFQDRLAVDFFNRDRDEMDALEDDLTPEQRQELSSKTSLCEKHGISYIPLGPDDELDGVALAAKVGKTAFRKQAKRTPALAAAAKEGITEEGDDL